MSGFVPLLSTVRPSSFLNRNPSECITPLHVSSNKRIRNIRLARASIPVPESNGQVPTSHHPLDTVRTGGPVLDNDDDGAIAIADEDIPLHAQVQNGNDDDGEIADEDIPLYAEVQDSDDDDELAEDDEEYEDDDDEIVMEGEEDYAEDDEDMVDDENWEDDDEAEVTDVAPDVSDYTVISEQDYTSVRKTAVESPKYSEKAAEAFGSFSSVVDVNITVGGLLLGIEDDKNNDLFSGIKFEALLDNEQVLANLESEMNITTMTHVQLAAIPRIQDGDNVVIQGHTGTGKTLGFVLPILEVIDTELSAVQAVIMAPSRELAMQISQEIAKLTKDTGITSMALIGGANPVRQTEKLRKKSPHIVVGTPGRLAELEASRALNLKRVEILVIDEVDQCLQAPFKESIEELFKYAPHHLQTVLVSATGDVDTVHEFVASHFNKKKNTTLLRVGDDRPLPKNIRNWYTVTPQRIRLETFRKLMFASTPKVTKGICFVDTPRRADIILQHLHKMKINAVGLRGTADKFERAEVVKMFRKGRVDLLVTTEIAARGLDVTDVSHVFNLDIPTDGDHYIHRAGRCGRVGKIGHVVTLVTPEKAFVIGKLQKELNIDIRRMEPRNGIYDKPIDRSNVPRRNAEERRDYNNNNNSKNNKNNKKPTSAEEKGAFVEARVSNTTSTTATSGEKKGVEFAAVVPRRLGKSHQPAAGSSTNKKKKKKINNSSGDKKADEGGSTAKKTKVNSKKKKKITPKALPKGIKEMKAHARKEGWVGNRS